MEQRRLTEGLNDDEVVLGREPDSYFFHCDGNAVEVLVRALEVLVGANELALRPVWPSLQECAESLPEWFVDHCLSEGQWVEWSAKQPPFYSLPVEDWGRAEIATPWTLGSWIYWMNPAHRDWLWWSAEARGETLVLVHVDRYFRRESAVPAELLALFGAAGAVDYEQAEFLKDRILTDATDYDRKSLSWQHTTPGLVDMSRNALLVERVRLQNGLADGDDGIGMVVQDFHIFCRGSAVDMLERARTVLTIVNRHGLEEKWPSDAEWRALLPSWFVNASETNKPEKLPYESGSLEARLTGEYTGLEHMSATWSFTSWTSWMDPKNREWLWMSAQVKSDHVLNVTIDQLGDPPAGAPPGFLWLFRASGAFDYDEPGWPPS